MPSYWITHPVEQCFISALSPEGVGQLLLIAERWPAGRYVVREHLHAESPAGLKDRACRAGEAGNAEDQVVDRR